MKNEELNQKYEELKKEFKKLSEKVEKRERDIPNNIYEAVHEYSEELKQNNSHIGYTVESIEISDVTIEKIFKGYSSLKIVMFVFIGLCFLALAAVIWFFTDKLKLYAILPGALCFLSWVIMFIYDIRMKKLKCDLYIMNAENKKFTSSFNFIKMFSSDGVKVRLLDELISNDYKYKNKIVSKARKKRK